MADSVLAILNFDFAAETILKAAIVDNGGAVTRSNGSFKNFEEILRDFRLAFSTISVHEVDNLHRLRNSVQHSSSIPSQQEVMRHKDTVQIMFDQICTKAYSNLTYGSISLALFINSENERYVLQKMEEAYADMKYADAVYYGKRAAEYHLLLLRSNLKFPKIRFNNPYGIKSDRDLQELGNGIDNVVDALNLVVDKLHIGDQYDNLNELLGGKISSHSYQSYGSDIVRDRINSQNDADNCRNIVYEFMTSTQSLLNTKELKSPYIFDLYVSHDVSEGSEAQMGFISTSPIKAATLQIGDPFFDDETDCTWSLPTNNGIHTVKLQNLKKGKEYQLTGKVSNEQDDMDIIYYKFTA